MCKTSSKVLNINFSESQTGVKRQKAARQHSLDNKEQSCPLFTPPTPPTTPAARVQPAQLQQQQQLAQKKKQKQDETTHKGYLADLVEEFVTLRGLLRGADAAAHGPGGAARTASDGPPSSRSARVSALSLATSPHMLPSSLLADCRPARGGRRTERADIHPLMFIKQLLSLCRAGWEECWGGGNPRRR